MCVWNIRRNSANYAAFMGIIYCIVRACWWSSIFDCFDRATRYIKHKQTKNTSGKTRCDKTQHRASNARCNAEPSKSFWKWECACVPCDMTIKSCPCSPHPHALNEELKILLHFHKCITEKQTKAQLPNEGGLEQWTELNKCQYSQRQRLFNFRKY